MLPASNPAEARVAILLATYNGGRFLAAQLESLRQQTHRAWHLFWRDDGSGDDTCAIIDAWPMRDRITRVDQDSGRRGVLGSFMKILAAAAEDFEYFAFCDQDDVWLPDKISRAVGWLQGHGAAPGLYCGRQRLVDDDLEPLGLSAIPRRPPGFRNALVQNIATGCTTVLNAAARRAILAAPPPAGSIHDWWSYIVVSGAGGRILFDPQPFILYRQHTDNAVGANASLLLRARRAAARGAGPFVERLRDHLAALTSSGGLAAENAAIVRLLSELGDHRWTRRWITLRRARLYRQTMLEDLLLYLWLAAKRLPDG